MLQMVRIAIFRGAGLELRESEYPLQALEYWVSMLATLADPIGSQSG